MPAPKATSHGFGGAGGAAGAAAFISAARAGVASAAAATAVEINFFLRCAFLSNAAPAALLLVATLFPRSRVPFLRTKRNNARRRARRRFTRQLPYFWANRAFSDRKNPSVAIPTQRPAVD